MRPYAIVRAGFPYDRTIGNSRKLRLPHDVAVHRDGRIFAMTGGSTYGKGFSGPISVLNLEDEDLGSFGWQRLHPPVPVGAFQWPVQIVLDPEQETLFITDASSCRVTMLRTDGEVLGVWGQEGSQNGQLKRPAGISFDPDGNVWVVDAGNHRVQKFTRDGRSLMAFGGLGTGEGQLNGPWGIHVDELGQVYVADWRNDRIQVFDNTGKFLFKFGESGSGDGQLNRPAGIAVDRDGDIYVCDFGNNRVQLFNSQGRYIQKFLGDATMSRTVLERILRSDAKQARMRFEANTEKEKLFAKPRSVRVDVKGYMYVPDYEHWRIQVYKKQSYALKESQILPPFRVPTLNPN